MFRPEWLRSLIRPLSHRPRDEFATTSRGLRIRLEALEDREVPAAFDSAFKISGGVGDNEGRSIVTDVVGNVYATGSFANVADFDPGPGVFNLTGTGQDADAYVTKTDPAGNLLWAKRFGGALKAVGAGLAVDSQGNVLATGYFSGVVDFDPGNGVSNLTSLGTYDAFVSKLDPNGNLLWARQFGGSDRVFGNAVAVDARDNVISVGNFNGRADFDPGLGVSGLLNHSLADAYVSKLDSSGNFVWARQFVSAVAEGFSRAQGVALDASGNVFTTGVYQYATDFDPGLADFKLTENGYVNTYVSKLDPAGRFVWAKRFGGNAGVDGNGIAVDSAGNAVIVGTFYGQADFDPGPGVFTLTPDNSSSDTYVSQLDTDGAFIWAKRIGGSLNDHGLGVGLDNQDNIYLTGDFQGTADFDPGVGSFPLTASGTNDAFVTRLGSNGDFNWASRFGGTTRVYGNAVAPDRRGGVYTTGKFDGTADFDPGNGVFNLTNTANYSIFNSKLKQTNVSGVVWNDTFGNFFGYHEAEEPRMAGAVVELRSVDGTYSRTQVTAKDGTYSFSAPADTVGGYRVYFRPPAGYGFVTANEGFNDSIDSDAEVNGTTGIFSLFEDTQVALDAGLVGYGLDFGFAAKAGGAGADRSHAVVTDADGNIYVTGSFEGTADFDRSSASYIVQSSGGSDAFIAKYTAVGALVWAYTFGDIKDDSGYAITVDSTGNVYSTGMFSGSPDFDPGPGVFPLSVIERDTNVYVSKLNSSGKFVWARGFGGNRNDIGYGISVDDAGYVTTTGCFTATADFNPDDQVTAELTSAGAFDAFISLLDPAGQFVWARRLGGTGDDIGRGVDTDELGNVHVTGSFENSAGFDSLQNLPSLTSAGSIDAFVGKLDHSGNVIWAKRFGGTGDDEGLGIALDSAGHVHVTGYFETTADFDPNNGVVALTSAGAEDVFVTKLDEAGSLMWAGRMGGSQSDVGHGLAVGANGKISTIGSFAGTADFDPGSSLKKLSSYGGDEDIFVSRLDAEGNFGFVRQLGVHGPGIGRGIAVNEEGSIFTTGEFAMEGDFDPSDQAATGLTSAGAQDMFLTRLDQTIVRGVVWDDRDGDGLRDIGEPLVTGAVVELFDNVETSLGRMVTGPDGEYSFVVPPNISNIHFLQVRPPSGFEFTLQDQIQNGDETRDSDYSPVDGKTPTFKLPGKQEIVRDAGLTGAAPAFGFVAPVVGTGPDAALDVVRDAAGNVYVSGYFGQTADFDRSAAAYELRSDGNLDAYVAKYTAEGALVWARSSGGSGYDEEYSVAVAADGSVYTTGIFEGTVDFDPGAGAAALTSQGTFDMFVRKLDADGTFAWVRRIGGSAEDVGQGLAVSATGEVYVSGRFTDTATFGGSSITLTSAGNRDAMVAKLDADGNFLWAKRMGSTGEEDADEVMTDAAGNVYVTGAFQGTADFNPGGGTEELTSAGGSDAYLWKLDPAGNYVWSKRLGSSSNDYAHSVAVDGQGFVYVAGEFIGTATITPGTGAPTVTSNGQDDVFVAKFAADGVVVWAKNLGGTGRDSGSGVAVDARGHVYATGVIRGDADFDPSAGSHTLTSPVNSSSNAAFVAELDVDGEFVRARVFGGSGSDGGTGLAVDDGGHVYGVGDFETTVDFDPSGGGTSLTSAGLDDAYLSMLVFATINGHIWTDLDGDGVRDVGDAGVPNATVELIDPFDGIVGNGNDVVVDTRITGADGTYQFNDPDLRKRYLRISPPAGTAGNSPVYREITTPGQDSNLDGYGRSAVFNLRTDPIQTIDAGFRSVPDTTPAWSIGTSGADLGKGVVSDSAGNSYVFGSFTGTADFDPSINGVSSLSGAGLGDGFVAKYSSAGALLWVRAIGGTGADQVSGVTVDTSGNVYVTGAVAGTAAYGALTPPTPLGGVDAFVAKLDSAGAFVWAKQYGGAADDAGVGVAVDASNNAWITGTFQGAGTFGSTSFTNATGSDVFLFKLSPAGAVVSTPLQFGGDAVGTNVSVSGIAAGSGGVFLAGSFTGSADFDPTVGTKTLSRASDDDAYVVCIRSNGQFGWAGKFGSADVADDFARGITLDSGGNVLFTGGFHGTVDFNPAAGTANNVTSAGLSDAYVCKLDVNGNFVQASQFGGTGDDAGTGIATDSRGYVYVTGDFTGTSEFDPAAFLPGATASHPLISSGGTDVFVVKLDSGGNFLEDSQLGGTGADSAGGIAVYGQGDVRVTGSFAGTADLDASLGSYPLASAGNSDIFVSQFPEFVIEGRVWADLNGNGIQDGGEPELTDATVELIDTADGIAGNGNDLVVRTVTSTTGGYQFIDPPDSFGYVVRITPPAAVSGRSLPLYLVSPPGQGTDRSKDSDLNAAGESPVVRRSQGALASLGGGFREAPVVSGGWGIGGSGSDRGNAITRDAAGNTFVAGSFAGTVDFDPSSLVKNLTRAGTSSSDGFVAKYDPNGAIVWVTPLGGVGGDEVTAITLDPAGKVLVAGTFEGSASFGAFTLNAHAASGQAAAARDVFVSQLDQDGVVKWARRLGGNKLEAVAGIAGDKDGNVFTAGTFEGTADFDPAENKVFNLTNAATNPPPGALSRDIFISKLTKDGNFAWAKKIGNIGDDVVAGIGLDTSGNVCAAGSFKGAVDFNPGPAVKNLVGDGDYVASLDNAGNFRWAFTYGNTAVTGITVSGGNVYTAGELLRKLAPDGGLVWERQLNGSPMAVAADGIGNVYTTGRFAGSLDFDPGEGIFPLTAAGDFVTDAFVEKFDSDGLFVYAHSLGGTADDEGRALVTAPGGTVFVTGSFQTAADFDIGDKTRSITAAGGTDAFVWKLPDGGVQGQIWNDTNGNGLRDPGEPVIGGALVSLRRTVGGNDTLVGVQSSKSDGTYRFEGVRAGAGYTVHVQPPVVTGLGFTPADQGGNDELDSDVNNQGVSAVFTADPAVPTTVDAGISGVIPPFGIAWTTVGPGESTALASTVDATGNIYVTGEFKGTVDFDPGSGTANLVSQGNGKNAFVAKYTAGGNLLWAKPFRGVNDIGGQGVAVDSSGFVYVTGRFQGAVNFGAGAGPTLVSVGGYDAFVTKLDPAGNLVWAGQLGGNQNDYGNGITVSPSGRVVVAGSFQGTADFDPGTAVAAVVSFGTQDVFVCNLTADGGFAWARRTGGSGGDDVGRGVATDAAGAVYVAGSFSGTADFDPGVAVLDKTSAGLRDAFVWKLDADGNIGTSGWASQAGGPLTDEASGIAADPSGRVDVTGSFTGTADFNDGPGLLEVLSQGATDAFVWQLSPTGVPVWAKGLGGTDSDAGIAVTANASGVYVAGSFVSSSQGSDFDPGAGRLLLHSEAGSADAFVAKLDSEGNRQWAHRLGGANDDSGLGISVDSSGLVVFAGGLSGQGTYDPGDGDQGLAGGNSGNFFFGRVSQTLVGGAYPLDSFEPNNSPAAATDLGVVNQSAAITGSSLSSAADEDWFRFDLLSSGEAGNQVVVDGGAGMELYLDGNPVAVGTAAPGGFISLAGRPAGSYLIRVFGAATPAYQLTLTVPKGFAKDASEPNETTGQAFDLGYLTAPATLTGLSVHTAGNEDWYSFDTAAEGTLSSAARIDFRNGQGDLDLELFDAAGMLLRTSAGVADSEEVGLDGLPAGHYLVRVTGHDGAVSPSYSLTVRPPKALVADGQEPNNTRAAAKDLGTLRGETSLPNLSIHTASDQDWFKFATAGIGSAGHAAAINFVNAGGDLDLRLYDANGVPLSASTGNGDGESVSLQGLAAGTYYLGVSGFSGATQAVYDLRIVAPAGTLEADRLEGSGGNQKRQTASVVRTPGLTRLEGTQSLVDLNLSSAADEDWFQFTTAAKGTAQHDVTMTWPAANGTLGLELYNAAGKKIAAATGAGGTLVAPLKGFAGGTYYARAFVPKNGSPGSGYALAFDAPTSAASVTPDDWTVMVYMTADSLTDRAFNDINEMEAAVAGLPGSVNVAVLWDQSSSLRTYPTGNGTQPAWGTTGRALIAPDTNLGVVATKFEITPEQNTGDPASLKSFVDWARLTAPANHYALVFWDHGGGLRGFNFDSQDGKTPDRLTTAGAAAALAGGPKLDLIAFDACFMGLAETGHNLGPVADVVVASQDAVPGDGFEYDTALAALASDPASVTGEELATGMVRSYAARYGSTGDGDTLAAVRTAGLTLLASRLGNFATAVHAAPADDLRAIVAVAASTLRPNALAPEQRDLGGFLAAVAARGTLAQPVRDAATAALAALNAALVSKTSDPRDSSGLSVYLPVSDRTVLTIDPGAVAGYAAEFAGFAGWMTLLGDLRDATGDRPGEPDADDRQSPNDTLQTATDLRLLGTAGITRSGLSLHNEQDEDWYRFQTDAAADSTLEIEIRVGTTGGELTAVLTDASNQVLATAAGGRLSLAVAAGGLQTYYLRFYPGTAVKSYGFTINPPVAGADRSGDNSAPERTYALEPQAGNVYSGFSVGGHARDWVRIPTTTLTTAELRRLTLVVAGGSPVTAQLRDGAGNVVSSAAGTGSLILAHTQYGAAESYVLVIDNPNAGSVSYGLRLEPGTVPDPLSPLDLFDRTQALGTGDNWTVPNGSSINANGTGVAVVQSAGAQALWNTFTAGDAGVQTGFALDPARNLSVSVLARAVLSGTKLTAYEARLVLSRGVLTAKLYRIVNGGTSAALATAAATAVPQVTSGTLRLEVQGRFLRLLVNGKQCLEFADSQILPAGRAGIAGTAGASFDNFQASAVTTALPLTYAAGPSGLGDAWQEAAGRFTFQDGRFVSGGVPASALYNPARLADMSVSADYSLQSAGQYVGLIARDTGGLKRSYYEARVTRTRTGTADKTTVTLTRYVSGAAKALGTFTVADPGAALSGRLVLEASGNELRVLVNSAAVITVRDASVPLPGRAGFGASAATAAGNPRVTALAPRFADNFDRPDNTSLGASWQEAAGDVRILGGRMSGVGDARAIAQHAALANVSVTGLVDLTASGQHTVGLIARQAGGSYYEARLSGNGDGTATATIYLVTGSTEKVLKTAKFKSASGVLRFDVEGSNLKLSLIGESITVTDTALAAAGLTGVHLGAGDTLDDFMVR